MTSLSTMSDTTGAWAVLPPYGLANGSYVVQAQRRKAGVWGPLGAGVSLTMPNAPKSATLGIIGRMSVAPPAGRAEAMYALIAKLMAAGVWSKLDLLHVTAAHHEQAARLNWISASYDLVAYNSPIFTADRELRGDGTSAWLDASGYNPSTTPGKLLLNSAAIGIWVRTPSAGSGTDLFGGAGWMARRNTGADWHYRINDGTSSFGQPGDTTGFYVGCRADATAKRLYRNGVQIATHAIHSTTVMTRLNVLGQSGGNFSTVGVAAVLAGANLTDAEVAATDAALRAYLITIGAIST